MTKMKKIFAVVLALAMLFTMTFVVASAEGTPTVTVSANKAEVAVGESFEVTVDATNAGAVDLVLNYDKNAVQYITATFSNVDVNKKVDSIKDVDNGTRVFLLDSDATLTFKATAEGALNFTVSDAVAANIEGTEKFDITVAGFAVNASGTGRIEALGATTRETAEIESQDLGFIGKVVVPEGASVAKIGIIAAFTANVGNNELNIGNIDTVAAAHKVIDDADLIASILANNGAFVSHVKTTGSYALMGKNITARFYVVFNNSEEVIYSNNIYVNDMESITAENGIVKNSVVKAVAAQINKICNNDSVTKAIVDKAEKVVNNYNTSKTDDNKQALLTFVEDNKALLADNNG